MPGPDRSAIRRDATNLSRHPKTDARRQFGDLPHAKIVDAAQRITPVRGREPVSLDSRASSGQTRQGRAATAGRSTINRFLLPVDPSADQNGITESRPVTFIGDPRPEAKSSASPRELVRTPRGSLRAAKMGRHVIDTRDFRVRDSSPCSLGKRYGCGGSNQTVPATLLGGGVNHHNTPFQEGFRHLRRSAFVRRPT